MAMALRSCHPLCQSGSHRVVVTEGQHAIADNLSGLVALAGDQKHVTLFEAGNGLADRFRAVTDFRGAPGGSKNRGADRSRIFAARIVVGDDDLVSVLSSDRAHQRSFSRVAVAARAEHDDQFSW